uniref:BPTI/Kunitz inhibitor domain-containing protein n=1 Tax=Sphenodon punctatus TaxID=8508 RepID=A0A8D0HJS1_SPHPU
QSSGCLPLFLLVGLPTLWAKLPSGSVLPLTSDVSSLLLDICKLPPEPSRCRGHFIRFFYNPAAKRCKKFVYGGCRGNKNNFLTQVECLQTCAKSGKVRGTPGGFGRRTGIIWCLGGRGSDPAGTYTLPSGRALLPSQD